MFTKPSCFSGLLKIACLSSHGRQNPLKSFLYIEITVSLRTVGSERWRLSWPLMIARRSLLYKADGGREWGLNTKKNWSVIMHVVRIVYPGKSLSKQMCLENNDLFTMQLSYLLSLPKHVFFTWSPSAYIKKPFVEHYGVVSCSWWECVLTQPFDISVNWKWRSDKN